MLDEWLSEQEAAAAIHKSVRTLRKWRRGGKGPPYAYFGRTIRYRKDALVEHFRQSEIIPVRALTKQRTNREHDLATPLAGTSARLRDQGR